MRWGWWGWWGYCMAWGVAHGFAITMDSRCPIGRRLFLQLWQRHPDIPDFQSAKVLKKWHKILINDSCFLSAFVHVHVFFCFVLMFILLCKLCKKNAVRMQLRSYPVRNTCVRFVSKFTLSDTWLHHAWEVPPPLESRDLLHFAVNLNIFESVFM